VIETLSTVAFWQALGAIIWVNLLLSGDNAVVIALAARSLPEKQQKLAVFWGSAAAIIMRVILTLFAVALLQLPYLKLIGGVLLLWIGVKLITPPGDEGGEHGKVQASDRLFAAIKTIIVADFVMSLDNVIAIAGAAERADPSQRTGLIIFGLLVSVPFIVFGSQMLMKVMERLPIIVTLGAALLGFVACEMLVTDRAVRHHFQGLGAALSLAIELAGAAGVVLGGRWLAARQRRRAVDANR